MRTNPPTRWGTRIRLAALVGGAVLALGCSFTGDLVAYDLPAEPGQNTMEVEIDGVTTQWVYTSVRPTAQAPDEQPACISDMLGLPGEGEPCRPEPLIFLTYDLGLDVDNTVPASSRHDVEITGYYQELESPPVVTELGLEVSYDTGQTWQPVATDHAGENTFAATISHPSEPGATVGLRVAASDDQGNSVVQTAPEVFRLR